VDRRASGGVGERGQGVLRVEAQRVIMWEKAMLNAST
jgi:hypothetical protein